MPQMEAFFLIFSFPATIRGFFLNDGEDNDLWKKVDEAGYVWTREERLLNDLGDTHGEKVAMIISVGHNERSKGSVISCSKRSCNWTQQ